MELFAEITALWQVFLSFWRDREIGTFLFFIASAVLYFRGHVKSEKLLTHTKDMRTTDEMNALREKIANMLRVIESILYSGVESYVYESLGGADRRLHVVRKSKPVDIKARDYLSEYHDALHRCVLEQAPAILMNELLVHRVAESPIDDDQEQKSARALRHLICYDLSGHAGKNRDVVVIENRLLPYEYVLEMYQELCVSARNLRSIKDEAVETEIREHRIPFVPGVEKLLKRRKKTKKIQKR